MFSSQHLNQEQWSAVVFSPIAMKGENDDVLHVFVGEAMLWFPMFFFSTVGLNAAVIRWYVDQQERVAKGHMQLECEC